MKPLVYFSYGMTKSGSTLAYELARSGLVLAGFDQPRLSLSAVMNRKKINFCSHIDADNVAAIKRETMAIGHPIAIKTHTRADPEVVKLLQNGEAMAHAVYRDPREIALSMLDHGAKSRAKGKPGFVEFETVDDTIENIRHQTNSLKSWLSLPNVRPLFYDDFAFDMDRFTPIILDEVGVKADTTKVIRMTTKDRFTQRNKARQARYLTDMTPEDSAKFESIFAGFYQLLIKDRGNLARDGSPVIPADTELCDWSQ